MKVKPRQIHFLIDCTSWPKHGLPSFQLSGQKNCTLQTVQKQAEKNVPPILDNSLYAVGFTDIKEKYSLLLYSAQLCFQIQSITSKWLWPPTLVVPSRENKSKICSVELPSIRQGHYVLLVCSNIINIQFLYRAQIVLQSNETWKLVNHWPVIKCEKLLVTSTLRKDWGKFVL